MPPTRGQLNDRLQRSVELARSAPPGAHLLGALTVHVKLHPHKCPCGISLEMLIQLAEQQERDPETSPWLMQLELWRKAVLEEAVTKAIVRAHYRRRYESYRRGIRNHLGEPDELV